MQRSSNNANLQHTVGVLIFKNVYKKQRSWLGPYLLVSITLTNRRECGIETKKLESSHTKCVYFFRTAIIQEEAAIPLVLYLYHLLVVLHVSALGHTQRTLGGLSTSLCVHSIYGENWLVGNSTLAWNNL